MAEHIWSVLCSKSVTDKESSLVSLFDVLENLTVTAPEPLARTTKAVPVIRFANEIVSLWRRSDPDQPEAPECKIELVFPDGKEIAATSSMTIELSEHRRFRSTFKHDLLPLGGEGTYRFKVFLRQNDDDAWHQVASLPLEVKIVVQAPERLPANKPKKKRKR